LIPVSLDSAHVCDERTTAEAICYVAEATDEERDTNVERAIDRGMTLRRAAERPPHSVSEKTAS
jgi:hypothetical protein